MTDANVRDQAWSHNKKTEDLYESKDKKAIKKRKNTKHAYGAPWIVYKSEWLAREPLTTQQINELTINHIVASYQKQFKAAGNHNIVHSSNDYKVMQYYIKHYTSTANVISKLADPEYIAAKLHWLKHRGGSGRQSRDLYKKPFPEKEYCTLNKWWRWCYIYHSSTKIQIKLQLQYKFSPPQYCKQKSVKIPSSTRTQVRKNLFNLDNILTLDTFIERRIHRIIRKRDFHFDWIFNGGSRPDTSDDDE